MKVSYYDLLGMIKEGNIPQKIEVTVPCVNYSRTYFASYDGNEFNNYFLLNAKDGDENYDVYLANCFLESDMFNKCIEIPNDNFEDIEGLPKWITDYDKSCEVTKQEHLDSIYAEKIEALIKNQKKIIQILKNK